MKSVLVVIAAVVLLLDVSALVNAEKNIQIKNVSPQHVLFLKGKTSVQNIGPDMGSMFGKIFGYIGTKAINPIGPPIALYFSEPGPEWKIGVAVPVPEGTVGEGAIESTTLPGGKMVSTTHIGSYEKLKESWNALSDWLKNSKYYPSGPAREVYIIGPPKESDPNKFKTELLWPIM